MLANGKWSTLVSIIITYENINLRKTLQADLRNISNSAHERNHEWLY